MASWVNNGSYKDLTSSVLVKDPISVLAPTSQEGGNQQASNELAMTAPGSEPVNIVKDSNEDVQMDPTIKATNASEIEPADDGKPQASGQRWSGAPAAPTWARTASPDVVRKAAK
jgi:hypothetical protein